MSPDRGEPDTGIPADPIPNPAELDSALSTLALDESALSPSHSPVPPHLSHSPSSNAKRSDPFEFGHRTLSADDDVFTYNAWDHVVPDSSHISFCESQYAAQRSAPVSDFDRARFNTNPEKWWDLFYKQKSATFFKDRKWLVQEFPVLGEITKEDAGRKVVVEVGAGAGNTAFPIMRINRNKELTVHAVDFSVKAVDTMRGVEEYAGFSSGTGDDGCGLMHADVWDAAGDDLPPGVEEGQVDVVIMIFIFSALNPRQWDKAVENVLRMLKPGGLVLFRDYGRGDLAQVRFKAGRYMEENFYVRGDGTRVYFFETEELERIWGDGFDILNLDVDRRLIVNRQRRIKMYRCWIQGRFRKKLT
ncbi:hypothetical protein PV10_02406 [Exophiala mesophila]|uniref:tRNA N(3)-methylcytidine methyltransferase n=1 Tax=Exophiala mesophila TaxID=212818 RepID=A0A0D1ZJ74_EXOME|nr:uncharacterized protein PV10_02406 [Exophiala mesophila]KIV94662.1 hypothetical protein PV10_02406 [Exophiala mesophila]